MQNITMLFSFHIHIGICSPSELYKIIEKIEPEVIFEELSADIFKMVYKKGNSPHSIESIAIKQYAKKYPIKQIPVDTYEKNFDDLFDGYKIFVEKRPEYKRMFNEHLQLISMKGYSYLNSPEFEDRIAQLQVIEENVLLEISDEKLYGKYKTEKELHENRNIEMIRNIYNYSKLNQYERALFICGAEHKKSKIAKISEFEKKEELKINWKLYKE